LAAKGSTLAYPLLPQGHAFLVGIESMNDTGFLPDDQHAMPLLQTD
jgi:hypothetical protein